MRIIYSNQELPTITDFTIFLAGPTYRSEEGKKAKESWRVSAVSYLESIKFDGTVLIPEVSTGIFKSEYQDQVEWEEKGLKISDVILFWIPRDLKELPGLTTNDEWGYWKALAPEKLVLGCPDDAEKVRYQQYYAEKLNIPSFNTLEDTLKYAADKYETLKKIEGYTFKRFGALQYIPLDIINSPFFKEWYELQTDKGNYLADANVLWKYYVGPKKDILFLWAMYVNIWIEEEQRFKDNECIISRFDLSSVVLYHIKNENLMDTEIVLIKEFRSPVNNALGYVLENPGGSSFSNKKTPVTIATSEIEEETGLKIAPERLQSINRRQLVSTLSIHKSYLYSVELTPEEMVDVKELVANKTTFGVTEDTERTYLEVKTIGELLKDDSLDFAHIGMILESIIRTVETNI